VIELAPHHKRGLSLTNPVMNAAGVLGFAAEYRGLIDFARLGAFVTNPLTLAPRSPAHGPNAVPLPDGVLIHTGLPNPGVSAAIRRWGSEWARLGCPVIVHLAATTPEEVSRAVERLERADGVSGVELGLRDDVSPEEAARAVRAARGGPPLLVCLPLARAQDIAPAALAAGADALTVGAPPRMTVPVNDSSVTGRAYRSDNLAAVLPALEALRDMPVPLIGAGGIFSIEHARAMLAAGAAAVQVDAAAWIQPRLMNEICAALAGSSGLRPGRDDAR